MSETLKLVLACVAGGAIGTLFFGGLWWTVRTSLAAKHPAAWFFGSFSLRMSTTMAGFYLVSGGHWQRVLLCLLGFVAAHPVVARLTRPSTTLQPRRAQEADHASEPR
jgi:F1F0 ATPase subunit 2